MNSHYTAARRLGYELRKFNGDDTRRIVNHEIMKYYVSKGGQLVEVFEDYSSAGEWLEHREVLDNFPLFASPLAKPGNW